MELCIKSDANKGQHYQKWLFAVSEINKIGIGFISIFLLKARVSYLTILSLPLKDETDEFVTCLVLPECLSVKIAFHPRTVTLIVMAPMPSLLFRCFFSFSASFKNSSPREKVGNCLRFWTGGWSPCFYPLLRRNIWIFFPKLAMAARAKKKILAKRFARAIRVHYRDSVEHAYVYRIWLRGSASYVINWYSEFPS